MSIIDKAWKLRRKSEDLAVEIPEDDAPEYADLYASWVGEGEYAVGDRRRYEGKLYKCLQAHTAQEAWNPVDAPSLWAEIINEGVPEWVQPGATNPYMRGDKVKHIGKKWVSDYDNNVWEPGVFGWSEI